MSENLKPHFYNQVSVQQLLVAPLTVAADQSSDRVLVSMDGGQMKSRVTLKSPKTDSFVHSAEFTDKAWRSLQQILRL